MSDWPIRREIRVLYDLYRRGDHSAFDEIELILKRHGTLSEVRRGLLARGINIELVDELTGELYDARDLVGLRQGTRTRPYAIRGIREPHTHVPARVTGPLGEPVEGSHEARAAMLDGIHPPAQWSPDGSGLWGLVPGYRVQAPDAYDRQRGITEVRWFDEWRPVIPREYIESEMARMAAEALDPIDHVPVGFIWFAERLVKGNLV